MAQISQAREAKIKEVAEIRAKVERAKSVVLIDYRGFNVTADTALRRKFRAEGVEYKVLKNKLVLRALNDAGITGFDDALQGPTAVAFGYDDIVAPARIIAKSIRETQKMAIKGGIIEGKAATVAQMQALALVPPKDVLIAQLLCMLTSPVRSLAIALSQIAEKANG